jgi:hypothetical protein
MRLWSSVPMNVSQKLHELYAHGVMDLIPLEHLRECMPGFNRLHL